MGSFLPKASNLSEVRKHLSTGHILQDHVKVGRVLQWGKEREQGGKIKKNESSYIPVGGNKKTPVGEEEEEGHYSSEMLSYYYA